MILCIGSAADDTFCHTVIAMKQANIKVDIIDIGRLALSGEILFPMHDLTSSVFKTRERYYHLNDYWGAWIRPIEIAEAAPEKTLKERSAGLQAAMNRLFSNITIPVINPPIRDASNFSKLFHAVSLATLAGWQIPRSCLTNNPTQARNFINACSEDVIFKGASSKKTWATLYKKEIHDHQLSALQTAPVLFQERINGPDVRVHVVGDQLFAEAIESDDLDYRISKENRYNELSLPDAIAKGCRLLSATCNIPFLGVDFKIKKNTGEWYFLEANSMPCYQGYDRRAKGAISRAMIEWLVSNRNG